MVIGVLCQKYLVQNEADKFLCPAGHRTSRLLFSTQSPSAGGTAVRHFKRAPDVTLVHAVGMFPHTRTEICPNSARRYELEESSREC